MGGVMLSGCVLAAALAAGGKAPADGGRSVIADRPHVFSMSCKVPSCNKELNTAEGVARAKVDLEVSRGGRVVASARDAGPQAELLIERPERDLVDFVKRDRNHPCVMLWSIGNEVQEHMSDPADAPPSWNLWPAGRGN